ncbi:MAG: lipid II:glycine glycyltransferase FemX [Thermoplasmata archaeon]
MRLVDDVEEEDWRDFVRRNRGGNIFQTPEMAEVYRRTVGYEPISAFAVENGEVRGLLLAHLIWSGRGILRTLSTRCILQGGPLCTEPSFTPAILERLDGLIARRALFTEVRNLHEPGNHVSLYESAGYSYAPHLNYIIDLRQGEKDVLSKMSKGRRKGIARAEKMGLEVAEVETEGQIQDFYDIVAKTYSSVGIPLADISLFRSAFRILTPIDRARFLLCRSEGENVACRAVLLFGKTIYDWYAGSLVEERARKADEHLVWNILKQGISEGFETFDFGGAGPPDEDYGPREFKRRFGGEMIEPGRFKKVYKARLLSFSKRMYRLRRRLL